MRKYFFTIFFLILCFFGVQAQKTIVPEKRDGSWTEFVSKKAGFKIKFPEKPSSSKTDEKTVDSKGTVYWFNVSTSWGYFAVFFSEPILPERDKEDLSADYDFLREKTAKVKNGILIKEREIYAGRNLGREFVFKVKEIAVINRLFLVNKKLYLIIISIDFIDFENEAIQKEMNKFFSSFTLLKKK